MWSNISNSYILREIRSKQKNTLITVSILGAIIIIFFFSFAAFGNEAKSNGLSSLVNVHILFRHGDRTPSFSYPNDPNNDYNWQDGTNGSLTNKGKTQMFTLGKLFRKIYKDFLPKLYNNNELMIKSSYWPRCQMSAATMLAGLYPPVGQQIWNEELLWQPIPVNPIPRESDNLITAKANCPAYDEEKKNSDEEIAQQLTADQRELLKYLTKHTGLPVNDIGTAESLYYTLDIQKENGLKLPEWTDDIFPEPLRSMALLYLTSFTRTEQLKRLQSGPLIKEWLTNLETSTTNPKSPLLYLYAGHDMTIINLMRSMKLMDNTTWIPEYGASLILELHKELDTNQDLSYFVKFFYLNSSSTEKPVQMKLPNCELNCPLKLLFNQLQTVLPDNWSLECDHIA